MITLVFAALLLAQPAPPDCAPTPVERCAAPGRKLPPCEARCFDDLNDCNAGLGKKNERITELEGDLGDERRARVAAERRLTEAAPPAPTAPETSLGLTVLRVLAPTGGAALGGLVGALGCADDRCSTTGATLASGGAAALGALIGSVLVEVLP